MNNTNEENTHVPPTHFKRIARAEVKKNVKQLVISYANGGYQEKGSITFGTFGLSPLDGGTAYPLRSAMRLDVDELAKFHLLLTWVVVRLQKEDVHPDDYEYIKALRDGFVGSDEEYQFEEHMRKIKFPPTNFHGGSYSNFEQRQEAIRRFNNR